MSLRLPRLQQSQPSWRLLQAYLNKFASAIETNDAAQQDQIDTNAELIAALTLATNTANAIMPDIAPITISADYTGTVNTGQLPRSVQAYRYDGATDVTASATWTCTVSSGLTASINATTGLITITAITASGTVVATSVHNGITRSKTLVVTFKIASAPSSGSGGGGGTSATDTSFTPFSSTTHAAVSDELTVTVGSSGNVQLSAPLDVYTDSSGLAGTFEIYAVWRWWDGASWVDVGAEVASSPDCSYLGGVMEYGAVSASVQKTGLVAAASEKFQLYARNASGSRTMYLNGEASAVAV